MKQELYEFDLMCPHCGEIKTVKIKLKDIRKYVKCDKCGRKYRIKQNIIRE